MDTVSFITSHCGCKCLCWAAGVSLVQCAECLVCPSGRRRRRRIAKQNSCALNTFEHGDERAHADTHFTDDNTHTPFLVSAQRSLMCASVYINHGHTIRWLTCASSLTRLIACERTTVCSSRVVWRCCCWWCRCLFTRVIETYSIDIM